jgi:anti-sigma-K factor RskA
VEHVDELIPAHALRILEGEDERIVVAHLAECERCRRQLTDYEQVAASLAYAAPRAVPPPELRDRVLGSIGPVVEAPPAERRAAQPLRSWWPRLAAVAVPALAACVVGLVIWNVSLRNDLDSTKTQFAANPAVHVANVGNAVSDTAGNVTLYADLAPAPPGKTYQAWVIGSSGAIPAGTFSGGGTVVLHLTAQARPGDKIAVTVEPAGGSKQPTTQPIGAAAI